MAMYATLFVVLVAIFSHPAQGAALPTKCDPDDTGCLAFAGDSDHPLPDHGKPQPVFLGSRVYMLSPSEAERERRCLALVAWAESRGEGLAAMAAVMWVVANRAALVRQPSTPCHVAVARGQFEPFAPPQRKASHARRPKLSPNAVEARRLAAAIRTQARVIQSGGMPSWPKPKTAADRTMLHAARVLAWYVDGETIADPTGGAVMFYSPEVQALLGRHHPTWIKDFAQAATVGDHLFFRLPPRPSEPSQQVAETPP